MEKVEKRFTLNGETFNLKYDKNDIKCFINSDYNIALITDKDGVVLFKMSDDCGQGISYLEIIDQDE